MDDVSPETPEVPLESVRKRALKASLWVVLSTPFAMVLQLVRSLVLTRLLFPEAFGLMALVTVVTQGLAMCSDMGIAPNVVQHRRGKDPAFLQTAWTLGIMREAILWLICCALAVPMARFYGQPLLAWMLPVAGLAGVIGGFGTTAWAIHHREMRQKQLTILAFMGELFGLVVMIGLAAWMRNVWALVIGGVIKSLFQVTIGYCFLPGIKHRLRLEREAARDLIAFGKWIVLSTLLTFLAMQGDKLVLGKLVSADILGIYAIALVLTAVPRDLILKLSSTILFPAIAERHRDDLGGSARNVVRARGVLVGTGVLLAVGVALFAPAFFRLLYDSRYWSAGWMAQYLAAATWAAILFGTTGYCLLALGHSRALAFANAFNVGATLCACLVGHALFGLPGFIIGFALGTATGETYQILTLRRLGIDLVWQNTEMTLVGLAAFGFGLALNGALHSWLGLGDLLAQVLGGALAWVLLCARLWPRLRDELAPQFQFVGWLRALGRRRRSRDEDGTGQVRR